MHTHIQKYRNVKGGLLLKSMMHSAYRNIGMSREQFTTFDQSVVLLYLHIGFIFARASVACAILEQTFGF